ncbi:MAG: DegV family EDD domain-containing protein [Syntrophaceae bacterium]|nr:DegV family EDD domain-containing protein [Syntrophaceae bacterium]
MNFTRALAAGVERVTAWSDLLDDINVFPVADGDTGRNLVLSLAPLRFPEREREALNRDLLLSARGNSGNIAARFFSRLLHAEDIPSLAAAVARGTDQARGAVREPKPGTMLTFFEALAEGLRDAPGETDPGWYRRLMDRLQDVVRDTVEQQPKLRDAGVVDAGALGMYLFFEGFFLALGNPIAGVRPVTEAFGDRLRVRRSVSGPDEGGWCVDLVLQGADDSEETYNRLSAVGRSVVLIREQDYLKVHLHTDDAVSLRKNIESIGPVVRWSVDDLTRQTTDFSTAAAESSIHIMTDAAGSLTREGARKLGVTLLDSYLTVGTRCLPETLFSPGELFEAMRRGEKVSTSQASVLERQQTYESVLGRFGRVLYLCVGSVFTGNYEVAREWKSRNDRDDRLTVIDTGAASGRLGLMVIETARFAARASDPEAVVAFARDAVARTEEYIFLDRLKWLAAGGRLSKGSAFFGDMLHMKPVISPLPDGAKKVGVVRNRNDQVRYALEKLEAGLAPAGTGPVLLEHSDNRPWLEKEVLPLIRSRFPAAEILLQPLSMTSAAHMGPETWAVAFLRHAVPGDNAQ